MRIEWIYMYVYVHVVKCTENLNANNVRIINGTLEIH